MGLAQALGNMMEQVESWQAGERRQLVEYAQEDNAEELLASEEASR